MQKFFVKTNQIQENKINITGTDVNHISNVLRMKKQDKLQICNEETTENYIVQIEEISEEKIVTKIIEKLQTTNESNVEIDLYQGLPKADKMELIIQKTVEVGINKIVPVEMIRCVVKLEEKLAKKKIERWQKISETAAKQSKRDKIPQVENKIKLKDIENIIEKYDIFLIAYEEETANTLKQELKKLPKKESYKIAILIGPEGGLASNEVEKLKKKGAKAVTLGKRILRCETAPITMASNIIYELEN